jgi:anti-sigma factor RsiW
VRIVTEYLDGALDRDERRAFEEHVAACRPCRAHMAQMRRTLDVAGRVREDELEPDAERALVEMFRDWRRGAG